MATEIPIPEWVTVGAPIVIRTDRGMREYVLVETTVERLTATLVITADHRRIPRRDVHPRSFTYLDPASPATQADLAAQAELRTIRYLSDRLTEYLRNGRYGDSEQKAEARTHLIDVLKATAAQLEV